MTREQALENALHNMLRDLDPVKDASGHSYKLRPAVNTVADARAALALPPDGVNAEMLAALHMFRQWNDENRGEGFLEDALNKANAVIARATHIPMPSKTFNPPAQA